jgi:bromodomain adjacent to zinc finger domain protein 1A
VWSCELTGRSGLTYQEAVESERHARKRLAEFPTVLKIPILLLMTMTRRRRLADARDDVFGFLKDRFFVGEEVMVSFAAGNK